MAEDVEHFIRQHNINDVTLLGHSMYVAYPFCFFKVYQGYSAQCSLLQLHVFLYRKPWKWPANVCLRGAKTAMAVSLRRPDLVRDIIAVDNAPIEAMLGSSFGQYVQAMRRIEDANIQKQSEADDILKEIEPVRIVSAWV